MDLLNFSGGGSEEFYVAGTDDVSVLGQSARSFLFGGEHDEGITCRSSVVFLDK